LICIKSARAAGCKSVRLNQEVTMPMQRSRLYPWYLGIVIIVAFEAIIAYLFFTTSPVCTAPIPQFFTLLLIVLPAVYLTLMYLALRSQP
jgi:hypothetical protein